MDKANVILGVDGMLSLRLATDCSGQDKTMSFICDLLYNVENHHTGVDTRTCRSALLRWYERRHRDTSL